MSVLENTVVGNAPCHGQVSDGFLVQDINGCLKLTQFQPVGFGSDIVKFIGGEPVNTQGNDFGAGLDSGL